MAAEAALNGIDPWRLLNESDPFQVRVMEQVILRARTLAHKRLEDLANLIASKLTG